MRNVQDEEARGHSLATASLFFVSLGVVILPLAWVGIVLGAIAAERGAVARGHRAVRFGIYLTLAWAVVATTIAHHLVEASRQRTAFERSASLAESQMRLARSARDLDRSQTEFRALVAAEKAESEAHAAAAKAAEEERVREYAEQERAFRARMDSLTPVPWKSIWPTLTFPPRSAGTNRCASSVYDEFANETLRESAVIEVVGTRVVLALACKFRGRASAPDEPPEFIELCVGQNNEPEHGGIVFLVDGTRIDVEPAASFRRKFATYKLSTPDLLAIGAAREVKIRVAGGYYEGSLDASGIACVQAYAASLRP